MFTYSQKAIPILLNGKSCEKSGNGRVNGDEVVRAWEEIRWKRKPAIVA